MSKPNTFFGEVTIRKSGYQAKSVKGATGYTLPNRPEQAYRMMNSQIDKEISKEIMFIPFPEIRNVIVTFMKPYPVLEKDDSEILAEEYRTNKQLQRIDQVMTQKVTKGYHQKIKLQKILKCFLKAEGLKNDVTSLKSQIRIARQDDLGRFITNLQSQADDEKRRLKDGSPQDYEFIELKKNNQIIEQLLKHQKEYKNYNQKFIELDSKYAEIKEFCQEMQKIVPIIWRCEGIPEAKDEVIPPNFVEYFRTTIRDLSKPLQNLIQESQTWLELFRSNVKSQSWSSQSASQQTKEYLTKLSQFLSAYEALEQEIKLKVYQKLKEIIKLDEHIVRNLQSEVISNLKNYENFVQTYTDIKQLSNTRNHWAEFERIISDQERYLSDHMRLNCGLIVYYKPTNAYEQFASAIVKRTYVFQIFSTRLTPIRNAIKFINEDYSEMYKRACEDPSSRSKLRKYEVQKLLKVFEKNLKALEEMQSSRINRDRNEKVYYEYMTHLILSLNRLMGLASD